MTFEDLCRALFAAVWRDPYAQKNGRSGQPQHGVDVYGTPLASPGTVHGVQCKGKDQMYGATATKTQLKDELEKAEHFSPGLEHWIMATTAPNDGELQRYTRELSAERVARGRFPVAVLGWESVLALLAEHPKVIESFYPEHAPHLPALIDVLRSLPTSDDIAAIKQALAAADSSTSIRVNQTWLPVTFDAARDLGPALMGRPLGPADVGACPVLPEADTLLHDLERGYSARLAGLPGAGKSVCALQAAQRAHKRGWRVVRLADPNTASLALTEDARPTLHLIDDAHLTAPALLELAEQTTSGTKWLLSAHTTSDNKAVTPGTIRLDAKRAVSVIAAGLRAKLSETLVAVRRADDRVGDRPGDELLEHRLAQAETAELPWQFCFILGGGWRRVGAAVDSARAARADLVLAATAVRQLASRDARCRENDLIALTGAAGLAPESVRPALGYLVQERLLLGRDDLRCPHQRFAAALLGRVLEGQDQDGRAAVGQMLCCVLTDPQLPLAGLYVLLQELQRSGQFGRGTRLINPSWLEPLLDRCWQAQGPSDIRAACLVLAELDQYLPNWPTSALGGHVDQMAAWLTGPPSGIGYALGRLLNAVHQNDATLAEAIFAASNPDRLAVAMSRATSVHACEIAEMISLSWAAQSEEWKQRYLVAIERPACFAIVANWPPDQYLSAVADYCKHFVGLDQSFGLDLIEALLPAISDRLRADPVHSFHELDDIVWSSLRVYDPLNVYVGKLAPTPRMREVARKLCCHWSAPDLAATLSAASQRSFQSAAGLLSFLRKAAPQKFYATVAAIDWDQVDATIGDGWRSTTHDFEVFLAMCHASPEARPALAALIERNRPRMGAMSTRLAIIAPDSGYRHVEAGGEIALSHFEHFDWRLGVGVLAYFADKRPDLVEALLRPHEAKAGAVLSRASPSWYREAALFLRLAWQVAPESFQRLLDHLDVAAAEQGWTNALTGKEGTRERGAKAGARQAVAFLINRAIDRTDAVGDLARGLRQRFPKRSVPSAATLKPLSD